MRALVVLIAIVVLFAIIGWISFSFGPGRSSINLETEKVRQDTQEVLESGSEVLQDAGQAVDSHDEREEVDRSDAAAESVNR